MNIRVNGDRVRLSSSHQCGRFIPVWSENATKISRVYVSEGTGGSNCKSEEFGRVLSISRAVSISRVARCKVMLVHMKCTRSMIRLAVGRREGADEYEECSARRGESTKFKEYVPDEEAPTS